MDPQYGVRIVTLIHGVQAPTTNKSTQIQLSNSECAVELCDMQHSLRNSSDL